MSPPPRPRSEFRPYAAAFLATAVAWLLLLPAQPLDDPGALWHIRVGEKILQDHKIPEHDFLGFARNDRPWRPQQWLAEVGMALAHRVSGFDGVLGVMAALVGVWGAALFVAWRGVGAHWTLAAILTAGPLASIMYHYYARPHVATIVLLGLLALHLAGVARGRRSVRSLLVWVPLGALWTNLHGGVLAGVASLGFVALGWLARAGRAGCPLKDRRDAVTMCVAVGGMLASTLANPYGVGMYELWGKILGSEATRELISEHQPIDLSKSYGRAILGVGVCYLLAFVAQGRAVSWLSLLPLVWLVLACKSVRHGPLLSATAAAALVEILPRTRAWEWLRVHGDTLVGVPEARRRAGLGAFAVVASFLALWLTIPVVGVARLDPERHPVSIIGPMRELSEKLPDGTPVFNDANLGGFVTYFAPRFRTFIDDRVELLTDDEMREYVRAISGEVEIFDRWQRTWGFRVAVTDPRSELGRVLAGRTREWREVAADERGAVYLFRGADGR
jgi:hypothetical protein